MQLTALMFVFCVSCVFEGSSLCYELITRSEEFYAVCACAQETSTIRQPRPDMGCSATERKISLRNKNDIIDSSKQIKVLHTVQSKSL
jgi:hypothetical protein